MTLANLVEESMAKVRESFAEQCVKLSIENDGFNLDFTETEERLDPFDNSTSFFGFWRGPLGVLLGTVQVHESGRVYAEYDLALLHPKKAGWFIESITAWGGQSGLKSELKLIPAP